jgi:acetyl esterase/lipase
MVPATEITALMDMGFVVVVPEYRLAPQVGVYDGPMADAKECLGWAQATLPHVLEHQTGIKADGGQVVAMGHSAGGALALYLGSLEAPPMAILDLYSPKVFSHSFWSRPLPAFAAIPELPRDFTDKVFEGPHAYKAGPMIVNGKPDLSSPRSAWMISTLKNGTNIKEVAKDGNTERIDPVTYFKKDFPPTCFIHGNADIFAPIEVSRIAHSKLHEAGAKTLFITAPGQAHVFDFGLQKEDALFQDVVMRGFRFLQDHVCR